MTALVALRATIQNGLDIRRNRAVHGISFIGADMKTIEVEVHRGKGDRTRRPVGSEEFASLADEIRAAYSAYLEVLGAVGWVDMTEVNEIAAAYMRATADEAGSTAGS